MSDDGVPELETEVWMRLRLKRLCDASSQRAVAKQFHYSPSYISDVLHGRRAITNELAAQMGYERIVAFRKWSARNTPWPR